MSKAADRGGRTEADSPRERTWDRLHREKAERMQTQTFAEIADDWLWDVPHYSGTDSRNQFIFVRGRPDWRATTLAAFHVVDDLATRYRVVTVADLTPETLARYMRSWTVLGYESDTVATMLGALKWFMLHLAMYGMIAEETLEEATKLAGEWRQSDPVAKAEVYRDLMASRRFTAPELARKLEISPDTVYRALRLLDLPAELRELVRQGSIYSSQALEIAKVSDAEERSRLISLAIAGEYGPTPERHRKRRPARRGPKRRRHAVHVVSDEKAPIELCGRGKSPIVLGNPKPLVSEARYDALKVLLKAFPGRVSKEQLEKPRGKGGAGTGARRNLTALRNSDPDWAAVISMSGDGHLGYGLVNPVPTAPTFSHQNWVGRPDASLIHDVTLKRIQHAGASAPAS